MIRRSFRQLLDTVTPGTVSASLTDSGPRIEQTAAAAYTIPTDRPESDGTLEWDSTTMVVAEVGADGERGHRLDVRARGSGGPDRRSCSPRRSTGASALAIGEAHLAMRSALRNAGAPGAGVDGALRGRRGALGPEGEAARRRGGFAPRPQVHAEVPIYGSGGFCSYTPRELAEQLAGWVADGIPRVKMKVGRDPAADLGRVADRARGDRRRRAVRRRERRAHREAGAPLRRAVRRRSASRWFEEPVSSLDLEGLRPAPRRARRQEWTSRPASTPSTPRRVPSPLPASSTASRPTRPAAAASRVSSRRRRSPRRNELDLSGHTAPTIHAHALCAVPKLRHLEWFHDHVRIERHAVRRLPRARRAAALRPDLEPSGPRRRAEARDAERFAA